MLHKGEICPAGFYCPEGSWDPIACKKGTYNKLAGQFSIDACLACPVGSFTESDGQVECKSCGDNAFNQGEGLTTCACYGKNRVFQPEKSNCMCGTSYEPVGGDSFANSRGNCQSRVYPICGPGEVYNDKRDCVKENDCNTQCTEAIGGSVIYNIGLCECNKLVDPDSICDATCRNNLVKYKLDYQNQVVATYTDGSVATVGQGTITGMFGSPVCASSCNLYPVGFSSSFFAGDYSMISSVASYIDTQPRSLRGERVTGQVGSSGRSLQSTS